MNGSGAALRDLHLAFHALRRAPGFTVIALLTLALGIGANTSMFGLLNAVLLQPLPYPEGERMDRLYRSTPQDAKGGVSPADYLALKAEARGYGEVAAYTVASVSLSEPGKPAEMIRGLRTSAGFFSVLGTTPRLGRGFRPEEETRGNHRVIVLGHGFWQSRFGGDERVVGRRVRVEGEPYEVVGVLPPFDDWRHLGRTDIFRPLAFDEQEARDRVSTNLSLIGRRGPGVPQATGAAFVAGFGRRLAAELPALHAEANWRAMPLADTLVARQGVAMLAMLVGLSAFVLLIACSNLANLLLARTMSRAREFAVRSALGASPFQVLRPLLAESLLLALGGGASAVVVAHWTLAWLTTFSRGGLEFHLDWHALAWAFAACLATTVAFAVGPALFAQRLEPNAALKAGARGNTGGRSQRRFGHALIVGQFALAMVLLAGAGLMVRGVHELNHRRYGWQSDGLVTGTVLLPGATYADDRAKAAFQERARQRLEAVPGVASAGLASAMPFFGGSPHRRFQVADRPAAAPGREPAALVNAVTPRYFETVGTRLLQGRDFGPGDTLEAPRVFVINAAMARGLFPGASPVGHRLAPVGAASLEWGEVVGVVADVESVNPDPSPVRFQLYEPLAQRPERLSELAVRAAPGFTAAALVPAIREALAALDPDVPLRQLEPAETAIARINYAWGFLGQVLAALAALGLGLAALGVYGVVSRATVQRTAEFGIRLALGATARDISRLVLAAGARLALIGSALGLLGAAGLAQVLASVFPGMQVEGARVVGGVTVLLVAVAQVACSIPARQAARVSPMATLRSE